MGTDIKGGDRHNMSLPNLGGFSALLRIQDGAEFGNIIGGDIHKRWGQTY